MAFWKNFTDKIKNTGNKWTQGISNLFSDKPITDEFWEELEDTLILGDVGIEITGELIETLRKACIDRRISNSSKLKEVFAEIITKKLNSVPNMGVPIRHNESPSVVVLIGVNGSGKTTTAGKLAVQLKDEGKKVIMAAADTFRAAAIDQLKAWGERTGTRVISQAPNSDPAAVVFDAINAAKASGADVVLVDTAGRLHNKSNLMEELGKIFRVIKRELPNEPSEVLIVVDSVTGQNGYMQAETFGSVVPITGVVLTKYDNTSKGGIIIAIAEKLKIPIRYVGLGENVEDLKAFDTKGFVEALLNE